jgi:hypothetical protein
MINEVKRYWKADVEDGGLYVASEDYDALLADVEPWKQTAEYWYGQYRLVKHGESPAEYPTEGKLDDWHDSYHNS